VTAKQAKGAGGQAGDECQNLVGTSTTDPRAGIGIGEEGDPMFTLQSGKQHAVAFQSSQSGVRVGDTHATLDSNNGSRRHNGVIVPLLELKCPKCGEVFSDKHSDGSELAPAECPKCGHEFATETATAYRTSGNCGVMEQGDRTAALNTAPDPNQNIVAVPEEPKQVQWASGGGQVENPTAQALRSGVEHNYQFLRGGFGVRRLTPTEAERLQGLSDGWTSHGMDEKGNMVPQSDSARYKQLGNAVTATVSFWIATRIKQFLLKS
jgi:DNA (cytosine-5)-methyltransferase 1